MLLMLFAVSTLCSAWPNMKSSRSGKHSPIGPPCTVQAHNDLNEGPCPNMPQPPPPVNSSVGTHIWPEYFIVQWFFAFVPDDSDSPPYYPLPSSPYNITTGRTYYHDYNPELGLRNMREQYDSYCIPVFFAPDNPMGQRNDYSCDFINVGLTNTSYVVLHDDRPAGAPECCIIGRPFHGPPRNFSRNMPVQWREPYDANTTVDWFAVYDKDAGIFNYGFDHSTSDPFAFYMKGVPYLANWMWQRFYEFKAIPPSPEVWTVPDSCATAIACPGW